MAAGEDQPQAVVPYRAVIVGCGMLVGIDPGELGEALGAVGERAVATEAIDRAPARGDGDPRSGIRRDAVTRPRRDRRREGILHRVLGELKVTDVANQRRQNGRALLPERELDGGSRVAGPGPPLAERAHALARPRDA